MLCFILKVIDFLHNLSFFRILKLVIIRADIGIAAVYPAETFWDSSEPVKAKSFIKVTGMDIFRNDSIELQNAVSVFLALYERVGNECLADMLAPAVLVNGIACVADMSASSYIVRVKYVNSADCAVIVLGNSAVVLRCEKFPSALVCEVLLLRKSNAVLDNDVPYSHHFGDILFGIFSYFHKIQLLL